MQQSPAKIPCEEATRENSRQFPNIHFAAHGDYQSNTSVFDLSAHDVPFPIHLVLWRPEKPSENGSRALGSTPDPDPGPPLTLLIQNSYFDIPFALKKGLVALYDLTDEVHVPLAEDEEEVSPHGDQIANECGNPWIIVHHDDAQHVNIADLAADAPEGFSPSSLITLPPHTGISRATCRVTHDLASVLRPVVKPGHTYSIRFPQRDILPVKWWKWGGYEELFPRAMQQRDNHDDGNLLLTLSDLPPSATGPVKSIKSHTPRSPSFNFRVVDHWPDPPVLQVKLKLVPIVKQDNPIVSSNSGSSCSQTRYTITATTTFSDVWQRDSTKSEPITVKLSSSQHIAVPFSPTHRRGIRQFTSPDILSPIYGFKPSLSNFHIIDITTGEDLVQRITSEHPQGYHHRREQFLTLHPGDEVVKQGIRLPYQSEFLPNGNRKPRAGDPGYFAPHVKDMVPGRKYRITLRDKRFWWREGTVDGLFKGVDEDLLVRDVLSPQVAVMDDGTKLEEDEKQLRAEKERRRRQKDQAKVRRRVFGNLQRGLRLVCEDELIVQCPPAED